MKTSSSTTPLSGRAAHAPSPVHRTARYTASGTTAPLHAAPAAAATDVASRAIPPSLRLELGRRAANSPMVRQDKVWSRFSNDKVDIGEELLNVLGDLYRAMPALTPLRGLSLGCSSEPQFRVLEAACQGGLYLVDIEEPALRIVRERVERQACDKVTTILDDFVKRLETPDSARAFRDEHLNQQRVHLVTLHHSLYYCPRERWDALILSLVGEILSGGWGDAGALHAVLMASESQDPTTTWLYNHFAGRFFGARNTQNLRAFGEELASTSRLGRAIVTVKTTQVRFLVDDFEALMGVVWMILLHPRVHAFSPEQQDEVTEFIYQQLWLPNRPLMQDQDHLVIRRGG